MTLHDNPVRTQCIHRRFERQAALTPHAIALYGPDGATTYAELNARANRLARHLCRLGVHPGALVALCLGRGAPLVTAMLAVLKTGAAYVPVDPAYPAARIAFMLADCGPALTVATASSAAALPADAAPLLLDRAPWLREEDGNLPRGVDAGSLAYVMYTSGSTGRPKGVLIEHRQLASHVDAFTALFQLSPRDRVLQFAAPAFDVMAEEVWPTLLCGAALVLRDPGPADALAAFTRQVEARRITVLNLPASFWHPWCDHVLAPDSGGRLPALRQLIVGSEVVQPGRVRAWQARFGGRIAIANAYGPTEATVTATVCRLAPLPPGAARVPIGLPLAGTAVHVLDGEGRPVVPGEPGELHIAGARIARGYLNRPDHTAERFVLRGGERMYRTGDLVAQLPDGGLDFLGRVDGQLKVNGHRVEPGDVEACLVRHPGVGAAVVVADSTHLLAYLTPADMQPAPAPAELQALARAALPPYMVPAAYVRLAALPLDANGKLDRRALPPPDPSAFPAQDYDAPQGEAEWELAALWCTLLKLPRVGRHDDFFALGGDAPAAIGLVERLRQRDIHAFCHRPTVAALAALPVAAAALPMPPAAIPDGCTEILPAMVPLAGLTGARIAAVVAHVPGGAANVQDIYPLSPAQDQLLTGPAPERRIDTETQRFATRARLDDWLRAVQSVVRRHDILRTAFVTGDSGSPVQVVWRYAPADAVLVEVQGDASAALREHAEAGLPLTHAPLLRLYCAHDAPRGDWVLLTVIHRAAGGRPALACIRQEAAALCDGALQRLPRALPFRHHVAAAMRDADDAGHGTYFAAALGGLSHGTTAFGACGMTDSGSISTARRHLDPALALRLRAIARRLAVMPAALPHLAYAHVLARGAGTRDVVFGTVLPGYPAAPDGGECLLGPTAVTQPLRVRLECADVTASVRATHAALVALLHHRHAPAGVAHAHSGVPADQPLYRALLDYRRNAPDAQPRTDRPDCALTVTVDDLGDGFRLIAQSGGAIAPERLCDFMVCALRNLAEALEHAPASPPCAIDPLPPAERAALLGFAATVAFPDAGCLHRVVEGVAARTPAAVALSAAGARVTYAALNDDANRLAHHLQALGVGPDVPVALRLPAGIALAVAALAVLKAGGACVPLHEAASAGDVAQLLGDTGATLLLAREAVAVPAGVAVLRLDERGPWHGMPRANPASATTPAHLAWIVRGQDGAAVPLEHRNIARLFAATAQWHGAGPDDVWALCAPPSSDQFIWELWGALLTGGRAVVVPAGARRAGTQLIRLLEREGVTVLNQTPRAFGRLAAAANGRPVAPRLRRVFIRGFAPAPPVLAAWHACQPGARVFALLGCAEAGVHATCRELAPGVNDSGAAGAPLPDVALYVLDAHGQPAPLGVAGDLYVGGAGLARGYPNQPALTARRFIANPLAPRERLFRTGLRARWRADGTLDGDGAGAPDTAPPSALMDLPAADAPADRRAADAPLADAPLADAPAVPPTRRAGAAVDDTTPRLSGPPRMPPRGDPAPAPSGHDTGADAGTAAAGLAIPAVPRTPAIRRPPAMRTATWRPRRRAVRH